MPAYQLSGITSITSGLYPVTGTPSGFTGPWLIETQSLTIQYARVPSQMVVNSSSVTSLSAVNVRYGSVNNTHLMYKTTARYSRVKSYETFLTSGFLQTQKFSVVPETDAFGEYYGPTSILSGTVLGPAGYVLTTQPYIRRVAWDDNLHSETATTARGTNVAFGLFSNSNTLSECVNVDATPAFGSFNLSVPNTMKDTYLNDFDPRRILAIEAYPIWGTYALSKETNYGFTSFLNEVGNAIRASFLFKTNPTFGTDIQPLFAGGVHALPSCFVGINEYNPNRHDFT